jgi:hypothetical protein
MYVRVKMCEPGEKCSDCGQPLQQLKSVCHECMQALCLKCTLSHDDKECWTAKKLPVM